MENLEICTITSKVPCHNCVTYWTKGIAYCTSGTCLRPSDKTRKRNKDRFVLSIPNYVIKKGPSHGARHRNTERQRIYHAAHVSAKRAKKKDHESMLDRMFNSFRIRESLKSTAHATASERFRSENDWVFVLNSSGPNGPMKKRDQNQERSCEESGKGNTGPHPSEQVRQRPGQPFAGHSEGIERVDSPNWMERWYLSAVSSSSSSSWWKSSDKWWQASSWDEQGIFSLLIPVPRCFTYRQWRYVCKRREAQTRPQPKHTPHSRTRDFFSRDPRQSSDQQESLRFAKHSSSHILRSMAQVPTCTPVRPSIDHLPDLRCCPLHTEIYPAWIRRMCLSASWLKRSRFQVMSPKISLKRTLLALVKQMIFHRSSMTSTCDSAESITTPLPESDLDDEQIRKKLASLCLQEREVSGDRSRVCHSFRVNSVSSSSHFRKMQGNLPQCSHTRTSSQETLPTRKAFLQDINQFKEKTKLYSGFLIRKKLRDWIWKNKDHVLTKTNSEILKRKCKFDLLNTPFVNFKDKLIPIVWKRTM